METRESKITHFLFTTPLALLYGIFFVFPLFMGMYYSLTNWNGIAKVYSFIGLKNYIKFFNDRQSISSLLFTLKYTVILVICVSLLSIVIALLLNSRIKFRSFFRSLFFFPAVTSMITIALIFDQVFYRVMPQIGEFLNIGFLKSNILADKNTALFGILFVHIWRALAIPTVLIIANLQNIPNEMQEAALIDGADPWQIFRYIVFPYIIPTLMVIVVLQTKAGFLAFDNIMAMTYGGPAGATTSIGLLIYQKGLTEVKYSYGLSISVILFIIIGFVSFFQMWLLRKVEAKEG